MNNSKDKTIDTIRYYAFSYSFDHNKSLRNYKDYRDISKYELKYRAINNWRTKKSLISTRDVAIPIFKVKLSHNYTNTFTNTLRTVIALRKFFTTRRYLI